MESVNQERDISRIKDSLKALAFPLLGEPRKIETGYEIVLGLEHRKRIAKRTVKAELESQNLQVSEVDVFIDECGHYAYALVTPKEESEVINGTV